MNMKRAFPATDSRPVTSAPGVARIGVAALFCFLLALTLLAGGVKYTYDPAGRLIQAEYWNGRVITYEYDNAGNLLRRTVGGSSAFCAHVASSDIWMTRLILVNLGGVDHPVTFTAYTATGQLVETQTLPSLPPNAAFEADLGDIFSPAAFATDIWVKVNSASDLKGVLVFGTRDGEALATFPMQAAAAQSLLFPYVFTSNIYYTGIVLINAGPDPVEAVLDAYAEDGAHLAAATVTVPALGKYVRLVEFIFDGQDPTIIRSIQVNAGQPLLGFELFGEWDRPGLAGLPVLSPYAPVLKTGGKPGAGRRADGAGYTLYYNEIPDPAFYYTGVTFSNLGSQGTDAHVEAVDAAGQVLSQADWPVNVRAQITREIGALFTEGLPAGAAYLKVGAPERLMGFELYLTRDVTREPFEFDGVIAMTGGARKLAFPLVRTGPDWTTTLKLTNLTEGAAAISVHAYGTDGADRGTYTDSIPARGHLARGLEEMFPDTVDGVAWLRLEGDADVIGDILYVSSDLRRMSSYMGMVVP